MRLTKQIKTIEGMEVKQLEFENLLPPLATDEFEALKADIKANGMLHPILVDEHGEILDGRHRYKIDKNAKRKVIRGLSDDEKAAFVIRCNLTRRNLSPDQKREVAKKQREIATRLRESDAKKWTQAKVAKALGVSQQTVSGWLHNTSNGKTQLPDSRVKINPKKRDDIAAEAAAGKPLVRIAADYGVNKATISRIVTGQNKLDEQKKEKAKLAESIKTDCGVMTGDFREQKLNDAVHLILTDPPYDKTAASMYQELASFAARCLVPGGWLLAYSGQAHLPEVYDAFNNTQGLLYSWTFCCLHSGGDLRFRKYRLQNGWKPIVAAYKPPLSATWDWFKDVVSGGKEKSDHDWQQAESEAAHFIGSLTEPGDIVCDPFCGSGTTLAAAKSLKRKWLGYDVDKTTAQSARVRLSK